VFNPYTEDLWLVYRRHLIKYTASSDYTEKGPLIDLNLGSEAGTLLNDARNGVFYLVPPFFGTEIGDFYEDGLLEEPGQVEPIFGMGGQFGGPDGVPSRRIGASALDESTGDIYTVESGGFEQPGVGGNIEVFVGHGAADASTQLPA